MNRPKLLDLYCCEGGAARGYERAGFDVYGVDLFTDIKGGYSRKRYPYPSHQGDVRDVLRRLIAGEGVIFTDAQGPRTLRLEDFAARHASPPCQHASAGTRAMRAKGDDRHPALIEPTRDLLDQSGLPYVIENVKGAALRDPVVLCGSMLGLTATDDDGTTLHLQRHRLFETNWGMPQPKHTCWPSGVQIAGSYGGARRDKHEARHIRHGGYVPSKQVQQQLLGIDWMTERGMHQALPPAYTEWVGHQLAAHAMLQAAA